MKIIFIIILIYSAWNYLNSKKEEDLNMYGVGDIKNLIDYYPDWLNQK